MWELVIVWSDGAQTTATGYATREEAEESADGFRMAFGEQVSWAGVRPVYIPGLFNGYI